MSDPATGWVALVRCPLCLNDHRVLWPSRWPPNRHQKLQVECPVQHGILVVERHPVWAEWPEDSAAGEVEVLVASERFTS